MTYLAVRGFGSAEDGAKELLCVTAGERVLLIGPNGAGKTSLAGSIAGLWDPPSGWEVEFGGSSLPAGTEHRVRRGLVLVPESRHLFTSLTVQDNLLVAAQPGDVFSIEDVHQLFPVLKERSEQRAGTLSGGEQQMLAIARGLVCQPTILVLDEPLTGLAPLVVAELDEALDAVVSRGVGILQVEQVLPSQLQRFSHLHVMRSHAMVWAGDPGALSREEIFAMFAK